jgi:cold shock CspA family protein
MRGKMLWFNEDKDIGLIATEDGEQIDVHGADFTDGSRPVGRCAGLAVTFELGGNGSRRAERVGLVEELDPRRARLRRGGRAMGSH